MDESKRRPLVTPVVTRPPVNPTPEQREENKRDLWRLAQEHSREADAAARSRRQEQD